MSINFHEPAYNEPAFDWPESESDIDALVFGAELDALLPLNTDPLGIKTRQRMAAVSLAPLFPAFRRERAHVLRRRAP